jgi:hypothetical protein
MIAGLDIATVAVLAGTSIQMIDRHYGHLSKHGFYLESAVAKVAADCYQESGE